jgi:Skp family chaperone for outer membrane proteins
VTVAIDFPGRVLAGIRDEEEWMKNIGFLTLLITTTLLLTLAFSASAAGPKAPVPAVPVVAAAAAAAPAAAMPERHPHIDEALESMRAAKHHLETAEPAFHGHRAKAIEHLDRAIQEAEICMREP